MGIVSQNASLSKWNPQYSNLDIDGTPEKYDTKGVLGNTDDIGGQRVNFSSLDIDGVPSKYDTEGQLAELGDNSSNLNPDGSPDRYNTQGILGELGDSVSNLNLDGTPTTYNTAGQLGSLEDPSNFNPDGTPTRYNTQGVLGELGDDVSNLNPDGAPTRYNTEGVLGGLGNNASNLDFNNTPDRYNTQGILGNLPPNASNLDFDGNLPAGVDAFPNLHANGFTIKTPMGVTQFIDPGNTSVFGFTGNIPAGADAFPNVHANGFTVQAPIGVTQFIDPGNTSQYGFTGPLPAGADAFPNIHANGFTIQTPVGVTQFIDPGNSSIYGFTGQLPPAVDAFQSIHAQGFTIQTPSLVTQFTDPGNTSQYGFSGPLPPGTDSFPNLHAEGFTIQTPVGVTQFIDAGNSSQYGFAGPLPPSSDAFLNTHANGFTLQNPVLLSQFLNDGQTSIFGWQGGSQDAPSVDFFNQAGPSGILSANGFNTWNAINQSRFLYGGQTSIYGFWSVLPDPISFFSDSHAAGFTIKNPIGISQFVANGQTSIYGWNGGNGGGGADSSTPPNVNFFTDTNARGFTVRQGHLATDYVNVNGNTYTPPATSKLMNVPLGPWVPGTATMDNQLGQGSSKFRNTGFSTSNKYEELLRNSENRSLLATWSTKRNSDSPLDAQYKKFKVRNEAYNPTYMAHPLILRGLQNPDKFKPQRWGVETDGDSSGLAGAADGGFIRGGATTAAVRAAIDTARIAKFLASPKGIVWTITQFGLGKSNPLVEKNIANPTPFNDTRTHLGITSLLSVPGTPFGLHFTRHGIPFANEASSYERVIRDSQNNAETAKERNRLLKIKNELFGGTQSNNTAGALGAFQSLSNAVRGSDNPIIQTISGLGGPNSVYGIGSTNIRRYVYTRPLGTPDSETNEGRIILRARSANNLYAASLKKSTNHPGNPIDSTASTLADDYEASLKKLWELNLVTGDKQKEHYFEIPPEQDQDPGVGTVFQKAVNSFLVNSNPEIDEYGFWASSRQVNRYAITLRLATRHLGNLVASTGNDSGTAFDETQKPYSLQQLFTENNFRNNTLPRFILLKSEFEFPNGNEVFYVTRAVDSTQGISKFLNRRDLTKVKESDSTGRDYAGGGGARRNFIPEEEYTPKFDIKKQYAVWLNNNKTSQGTIEDDKTAASDLSATIQEWIHPGTPDGTPQVGLARQLNDIIEFSDQDEKFVPGDGRLGQQDNVSPVINPPSHYTADDVQGRQVNSGNNHSTLPYAKLREIANNRSGRRIKIVNDFRTDLQGNDSVYQKAYVGDAEKANYAENNISKKYGFGEHGELIDPTGDIRDVSDPYTNKAGVNRIESTVSLLKDNELSNPYALQKDPNFKGDKINAIDYISEATAEKKRITSANLYNHADGGQYNDFIKFYFSGVRTVGTENDDYIVFRATVKNISDSFAPSWNAIQVMGRPEGPGNYSTFERTLSFDFTAYASTREELVPMWRKLNYLAGYTMPVHANTTKPGGPLFRITIGNMYYQLPAYFTGLTMAVNEEASWDLGQTADGNDWSKQLPNIMDVNCTMRILHDWRHQMGGRAFSLYNENYDKQNATGNWLWDSNIPGRPSRRADGTATT